MTRGDGVAAAADPGRATRWRALERDERQIATLWGVLAVSSLVLQPFWLAIAPLLPSCPFRTLTGVPCLSCGSTRAAIALLHGDLLAALALNPLATLAGLVFVAGGVIAPFWALASLPVPRVGAPAPRYFRIAVVATLLLDWVWVIVANR